MRDGDGAEDPERRQSPDRVLVLALDDGVQHAEFRHVSDVEMSHCTYFQGGPDSLIFGLMILGFTSRHLFEFGG